jgi:hypothetical protein
MAAFLKLDTSTNPDSLKAASGTDYEYAVDKALSAFAATDTGVGTLSVNPGSTAGLTSIGTFTDTYYPYDQNQHPVGTTITSTVYTFYQDYQTASEADMRRPVEFSAGAIQEQTDTALNADLISTALANLVSLGVGSYVLQPTAPVGGTWVAKATITNNLDVNESNVTYLWRKTAAASTPAYVGPVKVNSTTPTSLKEMIASEVQTLTSRIRNRIVATGIGKYAIQASAPVSGGTWTTAGAQVVDTSRTQSAIAYNGTYAGSYIGSFTGAYSKVFTGSYNSTFTGVYQLVQYGGYYSRNYTGEYLGSYTGRRTYNSFARAGTSLAYTGSYFGTYSSFVLKTYTGTFTGNYIGAYTGGYGGTFSGVYQQSFTGGYTGAFTGNTLNNDSANISSVYLWIRTA